MVEMTLQGIGECSCTGQSVLLLKEKMGERFLPISLSPREEQIIAAELAAAPTQRSVVYDLMTSALVSLGLRIEAVELQVSFDGEVQSCLRVANESGSWQVEADPVDAVALAFRQDSPILIGVEALEIASFSCDRQNHASLFFGERGKSQIDEANGSASLHPAPRGFLATLGPSG